MLYLTETEPTDAPTPASLPATVPATQATPTTAQVGITQANVPATHAPDESLNAATKGGKKGDIGRKGYGQCWECGEWGHPRRECPAFLKIMNKGSNNDGHVAALKGAGKYGKGGK